MYFHYLTNSTCLFSYFYIIKSWNSLREFIFTKKKIQFALIAFADFWALKFCSSTCLSFLFDWLSFYPPDSTQNSVFAFAFSYSFIKYKKRFLKTNTISTTLSVDAEQRICSLFFAKEIEMKNGGMKMHFNHISSLGLTWTFCAIRFQYWLLKISYWELLKNENCTYWAKL